MSDIVKMNDFKRLKIRIGTVSEVERIPGSRNLYRLKVDMGDEMRQIVTGLIGYYTAEELRGKVIAVLTNLKPARIFGQMSNGMLLAAEFGEKLSLLTVDREIPNGARVT